MVWKKNFVSVILWAVYFLGISAALMYNVYGAVVEGGLLNSGEAALMAAGSCAGIALLFILCRLAARRFPVSFCQGDSEAASLIEGVLFIALITAGIFLRIVNLDHAGEDAAYYDIAKVTENSGILEVTHGATYLYLCLLRILFLIVGNKWIAGIVLQLVLQFVAAFSLYGAVRKVAGTVAGLILLGTMMLLPAQVISGLTYSPQISYLCIYSMGFLCVNAFLEGVAVGQRKRLSRIFLIFFTGGLISFACYLDVLGLTLVIPVLFALHMKKDQSIRREAVWSVLVVLVLTVLFFGGFICMDAFLSEKDVLNIVNAWGEVFCVKTRDMWFWYGEDILTKILVPGLMVFGAWGFWSCGKYHRFSLWITMLLLLCVMSYFHVSVEHMDIEIYFLMVGSILAGIGIRECICDDKCGDVECIDLSVDDDVDQDFKEAEGMETLQEEYTEEMKTQEAPKQVKYIENPLPLPKKHVKKVLEYSVEPQEEWMHFDIEISEEDDFDI